MEFDFLDFFERLLRFVMCQSELALFVFSVVALELVLMSAVHFDAIQIDDPLQHSNLFRFVDQDTGPVASLMKHFSHHL
jgi:hypothetical protein